MLHFPSNYLVATPTGNVVRKQQLKIFLIFFLICLTTEQDLDAQVRNPETAVQNVNAQAMK